MGKINSIKGNKKSKSTPRLFMVSVTADIWAKDQKEACDKLAAATNRIGQTLWYEATELVPTPIDKDYYACMDNGKNIKLT